jgi:uridylate kinase
MKYKRIILKISGEALQASNDIIDYDVMHTIKDTIVELQKNGVQVAIVVGGGNIYRGFGATNIEEEKGHYMGMLASSINALALNSFLNKNGVKATFQNSLKIDDVADRVDPELASNELEAGFVVIFGGGTGKPFVSTDTGAA